MRKLRGDKVGPGRNFPGGLVVSNSTLPPQRAQVPSLSRKLRSHMPHNVTERKKKKRQFKGFHQDPQVKPGQTLSFVLAHALFGESPVFHVLVRGRACLTVWILAFPVSLAAKVRTCDLSFTHHTPLFQG